MVSAHPHDSASLDNLMYEEIPPRLRTHLYAVTNNHVVRDGGSANLPLGVITEGGNVLDLHGDINGEGEGVW